MTNVPILMYHSISDDRAWLWGHLACPVRVFEDHLRALAEAGFHTISLPELYAHQTAGAPLPSRPIVLTFDDGYLDNWVYAYPLLKRYGFRGTIFASPDFVDPTPQPRPNLDDVAAGRSAATALPRRGYLSWAELRLMVNSGVMDVQAHALTHTWYFTEPAIVDFHRPGAPYPWLAWNAYPERKYRWLDEDQAPLVPWGTPVHRHDKALVARRYFPDPRLAEWLAAQVAAQGGAALFQEPGWRERLLAQAADFRAQHELHDTWESPAEYETRLRHELGDSKAQLEAHLHQPIRFLCWPGGGYNATTERLAQELGYLATTLSSTDPRRAHPEPRYLIRWGAPTLPRHGQTLYRDGRYLVAILRCRAGDATACWKCKALTARDLVMLEGRHRLAHLKSRSLSL